MLRRIFGSKRGEVTGEWRKLYFQEVECSGSDCIELAEDTNRWQEVVMRF